MVNKKIERYYWFIGVLVGSVVLSIVLVVFAVIPSFNSIKKVEADIKVKKEDLSILTQKLDKLKELKSREAELKEKEAIVNKAIPTKKEVGDLFIELEGIINETGGTNSGISESQGVSEGSKSKKKEDSSSTDVKNSSYMYSVTFSDYKNFKKFLERSENALRFISLEKFNVSSPESSFNVNLTYKSYYRNQGEEQVSVAGDTK